MDKDIERNSYDIRNLYKMVDERDKDYHNLRVIVNTISTKLVLYAGIGAFLGGGIMSIVVGWFLKH